MAAGVPVLLRASTGVLAPSLPVEEKAGAARPMHDACRGLATKDKSGTEEAGVMAADAVSSTTGTSKEDMSFGMAKGKERLHLVDCLCDRSSSCVTHPVEDSADARRCMHGIARGRRSSVDLDVSSFRETASSRKRRLSSTGKRRMAAGLVSWGTRGIQNLKDILEDDFANRGETKKNRVAENASF